MIYDANSVDIIGERQDGGIDFIIISSGAFDDSPEQQTILLDCPCQGDKRGKPRLIPHI